MTSFDSSSFDRLTGLMTPVYFYESLSRLRSWAQRSDNPVTLIAINLKDLSDDQLLEVARELNSELREGIYLREWLQKILTRTRRRSTRSKAIFISNHQQDKGS